MERMLEVRDYLKKVEEKIKASDDGVSGDTILHCTGSTDTGVPVFFECEFSSKNPYKIDAIDEDNVIFVLSDGTIIERVGKRSKKNDENIAKSIIEGDKLYREYYNVRYGDKLVPELALEAMVKNFNAIYVTDKTVYMPKYAGAFTTPVAALWRIAIKFSDLFAEYKCVEVENLEDNPDCHIEFE